MVLAKRAGLLPRDLATRIIDALPDNTLVETSNIAGPDSSIFSSTRVTTQVIKTILETGNGFGCCDRRRQARTGGVRISNPTGPLHVGHGRGAAIGDSLSRLLEATGWQVHREFYYNDAGQQINNLHCRSSSGGQDPDHPDWPKDGYQGSYIEDVARPRGWGRR